MPMRLLAVADVYEALTSDRPYRRRHGSDGALALMRPEVPQRLDPEAFSTLERLLGGEPGAHAARGRVASTSSGAIARGWPTAGARACRCNAWPSSRIPVS